MSLNLAVLSLLGYPDHLLVSCLRLNLQTHPPLPSDLYSKPLSCLHKITGHQFGPMASLDSQHPKDVLASCVLRLGRTQVWGLCLSEFRSSLHPPPGVFSQISPPSLPQLLVLMRQIHPVSRGSGEGRELNDPPFRQQSF